MAQFNIDRAVPVEDAGGFDLSRAEFAETPGGAATGIQRQPRLLSPSGESALDIAGAGGIGAVMGAAAPEILTGIAGGLRQLPPGGTRLAPWFDTAAIGARAAGRKVTALSGGMGGLASESGGQLAEGAGAGPVLAEGVRFVAGGLTPELLPVAKGAVNVVLDVYRRKLPTTVEASFIKNMAMKIAAKLQGRPQDIDAQEAAYLNKLVDDMRGGAATDKPMRDVYGLLQTGASQRLAVGDAEARAIILNANRQIAQEMDTAIKGPVAYSEKAAERIGKRGQEALATAQLQRLNVGDDVSTSDIGERLRSVVVPRHQAALAERKAQDTALREKRDTLVGTLESAGKYVDVLPEYKVLVASLNAELKPGKHSPEVADNFRHILNQVTTKAPPSSPSPFGGMGQDVMAASGGVKPPVSFQMLDDVRRQLGQVFEGNPPTGYAAIDAETSRKYYGLIAALQKKFAGGEGGAHDLLQKAYADATKGLEMYGSKVGKRVTAVDRNYESLFQTDAATLPRQFFSTRQGVRDLLELSGDRTAVVKAAKDFATAELNNLNEAGVRKWMTTHRDMLGALPEVRSSVMSYANQLHYGESTARRAEQGTAKLDAYRQARLKETQQRGASIERDAAARGKQAITQRETEATSLLGPKGEMFPAQNIVTLIESGNTNQWAAAAPHILASPGGKQALSDSIVQVLGDRAMQSTKGLSEFFTNNVRPAVTATKLMSEAQQNRIARQLYNIENLAIPEPQKIGFMKRVVLQSFAGLGASAASRSATSLVNLVPTEQPYLQ